MGCSYAGLGTASAAVMVSRDAFRIPHVPRAQNARFPHASLTAICIRSRARSRGSLLVLFTRTHAAAARTSERHISLPGGVTQTPRSLTRLDGRSLGVFR